MSAQLENGYIRIANEIWDEIIRRDFSKRQKDILNLILRLSYGCNKKTAIIPKLKHFSLCGVGPTKIAAELKYLIQCKVLEWDKEEMKFGFNKNYEYWQVSPVMGWDDEMFQELIHTNLQKSYQNGKLPKREVTEKVSENLPKREVGEPSNPCGSKDEGVSKDSIKDSIKDITTTTEIETVGDAYTKVFGTFVMTSLFTDYFNKLRKLGYTDRFMIELLLEAGESGTKPSLRFVQTIADRWMKDNIYSRSQAKEQKSSNGSSKVARVGQAARQQLPTAEEDAEIARQRREKVMNEEFEW